MFGGFPGVQKRCDDGHGQDAADDAEREADVGMVVFGKHHFYADENEDDGEAETEVAEVCHDAVEGEVDRAQAENREDVRGENNEGVLGDREDGGDGVDGEGEVGAFDHEEDDEERGGDAAAFPGDEKVAVAVAARDGEVFSKKADDDVFGGVDIVLFWQSHFDAGEDEKNAEAVDEPFEAVEEADAGEDEDEAHGRRADDAPEKDAVLVLGRHLEKHEDDDEDKDVVHAQAELDEVAGEEFEPALFAHRLPDDGVEDEREADPHAAPAEGFFHFRRVRFFLKNAEVEREHQHNEREKADPCPERDVVMRGCEDGGGHGRRGTVDGSGRQASAGILDFGRGAAACRGLRRVFLVAEAGDLGSVADFRKMPTNEQQVAEADQPNPREKAMGFFEHLEEMRWTIVKCAIVLVVCAAIVGAFMTGFNQFVMRPLNEVKAEYTARAIEEARAENAAADGAAGTVIVAHPAFEVDLGTTSLAESFTVVVQIVCMGGFVLAAPFMVVFIGKFVSPALNERELRLVLPVCGAATVLFLAGAAFGFFILVPNTIRMSIEINQMLGFVMRWTPSSYYSLLLWLVLGVGATFEFPLVILAAVSLGVLRVETLKKYRRHAVVVIFILAAIITPTIDPVSQTLFALPLYALFELSILAGARVQKKRELREQSERDGVDDLTKG